MTCNTCVTMNSDFLLKKLKNDKIQQICLTKLLHTNIIYKEGEGKNVEKIV